MYFISLTMHQAISSNYLRTKRLSDGLMPKADTQKRDFSCKMLGCFE